MNRAQTYYFIGTLLSRSSCPDRKQSIIREFQSPEFDWQLFINIGSNHLVLQTIYCRLLEDNLTEYLPVEILEHLNKIYNLNHLRNSEILNQVNSINTFLNDKGIIPLYMKGVGNIIDNLYNNISERIMHDIDILLPEEQWENAAQILMQNGYKKVFEYDPEKHLKLKHYPPLYKPGTKVTVEIHRLPIDYEYSHTINTNEIWDNKKLISNYGKCYVMCDKHKMVINFLHSQIVHLGHLYAKVHLRNLYDLYLLSSRIESKNDFLRIYQHCHKAESYYILMLRAFNKDIKITSKNIKHKLFLMRYELNLHSRLISLITFYTVILFRTYIRIPIMSIKDKELRNSLPKKILDRNWYKRHYRSITRITKINAG